MIFCSFPKKNYRRKGRKIIHTNIGALNGRSGRLEAQADILKPSSSAPANALSLCAFDLVVQEDVRLLQKGALRLDGKLGRHG